MRLRDTSLNDQQLRARAHRAADLLEHEGWADIRRELEEKRDEIHRKILRGVDDYVTYRQYCARVEVLDQVLSLPDTFIEGAPKEESRDE